MDLIKRIYCVAGSTAIAFSLAFGLSDSEGDGDYSRKKINSEISMKLGVDIINYKTNLGKIQTTSVHPEDGGASKGESMVEIDGSINISPKLKLVGTVGTKNLRARLGFNVRYNPSSDKYRRGIYETKLQPLPFPYESYAFTQLNPDALTFTPSLGIETVFPVFYNNIKLFGELVLPYNGFEVRSGHDRYGRWETAQRDSWRGFGKGFNVGIEGGDVEDFSFFLSIGSENYTPEFLGEKAEIDTQIYSVGLKFGF